MTMWRGLKIAVVAAALAAAGCQSAQNLDEGERLIWRCDGGKEFSLRAVPGAIEVFASGQTHRLVPVAGNDSERRYSNGEVDYVEADGRASLTGVHAGPFENCRRRSTRWRLW